MIKKFVKRILWFCNPNDLHKIRYFLSGPFISHFIHFLMCKEARLILIDTPNHINLGDHAIAIAEKQFLHDNFGEKRVCEFSQEEYKNFKKIIRKKIKINDTILIHGGGFIGTLWMSEEKIFLDILDTFKKNKILIMPQTVFFSSDVKGNKERLKVENAILKCKDLTICLREKKSYELLLNRFDLRNTKICLMPDIVTYLKIELPILKRKGILLCLREDLEGIVSIEEIKQVVEKSGKEYSFTNTVVEQHFPFSEREDMVRNKLIEFSSAELIITDRLHGMLFAALSNTPCLALDNVSGKVRGVYEWIRKLDYVDFLAANDLSVDVISKFIDLKDCSYSNESMKSYYLQLSKLIDEQSIV